MGFTPIMGGASDELTMALLARVVELEDACARSEAEIARLRESLAREREPSTGLGVPPSSANPGRQHTLNRSVHGQLPAPTEHAVVNHGGGPRSSGSGDVDGRRQS
jgi:hypothetical protein